MVVGLFVCDSGANRRVTRDLGYQVAYVECSGNCVIPANGPGQCQAAANPNPIPTEAGADAADSGPDVMAPPTTPGSPSPPGSPAPPSYVPAF